MLAGSDQASSRPAASAADVIMPNDQQAGDFEWTVRGFGPALRSTSLAGLADHFFTTRQLRLRGPGVEEQDWALVADAIGVDAAHVLRPRQIHGSVVGVVRRGESARRFSRRSPPEADAVITDDPAVAVAVQVADCVPILIGDSRTGVVAAVHAGWRGTAIRITEEAVRALETAFTAKPGDLVAALGPSIGPCCYEVRDNVREAFRAAGHRAHSIDRWFTPQGGATNAGGASPTADPPDGRFLLDLWTANIDQLAAAGVPAERIHAARLCTVHRRDLFFSYRAEGSGTGRTAAVIRARG
jgi:YfiH family protein